MSGARTPDEDARDLLDAGLETARPAATGAVAPDLDGVRARFPELEILEVVGQGGMGVVYRARERSLDREVALKVLPEALSADPQFAERFTREARTLARLRHAHIVGVHAFGEREGLWFLLMEFVAGVNLRQLMASGALSPAEALALIPQICDALQYAHDQGVIHRDIKPENVLLDKRGQVKVADFGLAKFAERRPGDFTLTGTHQVMGTLHYMAPEQMRGAADVDHRADIFSLGVVFYEMLTGELPVGRFKLPSTLRGTDARLDEIVLRALEREREERYQQISEVQADVTRVDLEADGGHVPRAAVPGARSPKDPAGDAALGDKGVEWPPALWKALWHVPASLAGGLAIYLIVYAAQEGKASATICAASIAGVIQFLGIEYAQKARKAIRKEPTRFTGKDKAAWIQGTLWTLILASVALLAYGINLQQEKKRTRDQANAALDPDAWYDARRIPAQVSADPYPQLIGGPPDNVHGHTERVLRLWHRYVVWTVGGSTPHVNETGLYVQASSTARGLPIEGNRVLRAPPWDYRLTHVVMNPANDRALLHARLREGGPHYLAIPLRRHAGRWHFATSPVIAQEEPIPLDPPR